MTVICAMKMFSVGFMMELGTTGERVDTTQPKHKKMLFNSIEFFIFLRKVFLLHWFVFQKNLNLHNGDAICDFN